MLATLLWLCLPLPAIAPTLQGLIVPPHRAMAVRADSRANPADVSDATPDADRDLVGYLEDDSDEGRLNRRVDRQLERLTGATRRFPLMQVMTCSTARAVELTSRPLFCVLCTLLL